MIPEHYRRIAVPFIPYFYIWGLQWMVSAALEYAPHWDPQGWLLFTTTAVSLLISAIVFVYNHKKRQPVDWRWSALLMLPLILLLASIILLHYIRAIDPFFIHLFRVLALAVIYAQLGVFLGRAFVFLGLWLFALAAIISIWYLGYSAIVLGFLGGVSLVAGGWMISLWKQPHAR